jgi:hypothetical protein
MDVPAAGVTFHVVTADGVPHAVETDSSGVAVASDSGGIGLVKSPRPGTHDLCCALAPGQTFRTSVARVCEAQGSPTRTATAASRDACPAGPPRRGRVHA